MYERPVRPNGFPHLTLRFPPPSDYAFCRHLTAVPLMGVEFPAACRQYPIVPEAADFLVAQNVGVVLADRERFGVRNTLVVDESKLASLPPETVKAFLTSGFFGWIYAT